MIIPYDDLREHLGGRSVEDVIVRLNQLGVRYLIGKRGRPFTTEFALNSAMGLISAETSQDVPAPIVEIK